jgi:nicotinamidase-related amidase
MTNLTPGAPFRLSDNNLGLVVVDIQEKFRPVVPGFDTVAANSALLAQAFRKLSIPVFATEQYPQGLGPTVESVASALAPSVRPLPKKSFSCCGAGGFMEQLEQNTVRTVCVCGVETHVCVYQTVLDLIAKGSAVVIAADACGSRKDIDHVTALKRMESCGAVVMTVEMILFDLLRTADHQLFKEIQRLVK